MKKIMFNDKYGLTDAVLSRRKTMTRRIVPIDLYNQTDWKAVAEGDFEAVVDGEGYYHDIRNCGKYRVGEEVAIAQSYRNIIAAITPSFGSPHAYDDLRDKPGWNNKMFVKAEYMPHRIHITGIKTERLQDISDKDCLREGVEKWMNSYIVTGIMERGKHNVCFDTPRDAFANLIDKVSGKGTWQSNPYVFAYTFELIR